MMENVPPPKNNPNVPEEEPILDQAPAALVGFVPQWIGIADADDVPIPPVIQFGSNFHIGESSSMRDFFACNSKVYAPCPM
uniref:Uncharacterized protein n=1 Tax=Tanacetum cinerariifolium TaxID=118510 RepID=A0A699S2X3_TANCI|nr:hypothetical protein [Tanacetum cinerariifolium]